MAAQLQPSGFKLRAAGGRAARLQSNDKEALEKQRLAHRCEGFERYEDPGKITEFAENSLGFVSESERFDRDFAMVHKEERDASSARHEAVLATRRAERMDADEATWKQREAELQLQEERVQYLQKSGKAKATKGSEPYDLLTLKYHDDSKGAQLAHVDDLIRYRAVLRAQSLHRHSISVPYNPLTGEEVVLPPTPDRPPSPPKAGARPF